MRVGSFKFTHAYWASVGLKTMRAYVKKRLSSLVTIFSYATYIMYI